MTITYFAAYNMEYAVITWSWDIIYTSISPNFTIKLSRETATEKMKNKFESKIHVALIYKPS